MSAATATSTNTNQTVNNNTSGTTSSINSNSSSNSNSSNTSSSGSSSSSSTSSTTNCNNNSNTNINDSSSHNRNKCNLIVNYLPQSLKENDFCQLFAKIGPIKTCKLMYDRQTGYSFGYGFVDYQNADDATKAIETLNGFQLEHKRLKVAYARPNSEDTKNTNLYIKNIPNTYDEQNLLDLFSQYGEVVQVRLLRDQVTAFSKRVGFVIMSTKQMAQQAIDNLDNHVPPNGTEPIHVKYADEEGKKRQAPRGGAGGGGSSGGSLNGFFNGGYKHNNHHNGGGANGGFQNHGKMKSRGQNGQNRYNPMGASFAAYQAANVVAGFDAFLNGANGGASTTGGNSHHQNHHHQQQQHHQQQHHHFNMNTNNHYSSSNHHQQHHHNHNNNNNNNHHNHHHRHNNHHNHHNNNANGNNNHHHNSHHHQNGAATIQLTQNSALSGVNDADLKGGHIIYVYGIGPHANESDLYSLFQNIGRILRVNVIKNQKTGLGKGYGFVVFEHYEEACFAVQQMNGYVYHARPLQVSLKAFNK